MARLFRVTISAVNSGVNINNVLHMDDGGTGGSSMSAADLCAAVRDHWATPMASLLNSAYTVIGVTALEVKRLGEPEGAAIICSVPGALGTPAEAPQLAAKFSIKTGLHGRARQGRFFQSGLVDSQVEVGKILSDTKAGLENVLTVAIKPQFVGTASSGFRLGVFSRKYWSLLSNPFEDYWKPATDIQLATVMSTMRRRKPA